MSGAPAGSPALNLHATTVVVAEHGILIRGPAGAGKSRLGLTLVAEACRAGGFARLVADDRTLVTAAAGRLLARPHPTIAGFAERRGIGILAVAHEPACVLRLVVDLVGSPTRLPSAAESRTEIRHLVLPRLAVAADRPVPEALGSVFEALARLRCDGR